jgi:hypothetical protein
MRASLVHDPANVPSVGCSGHPAPDEGTAITVPSPTEYVSDEVGGKFTIQFMVELLILNGMLGGINRCLTGIPAARGAHSGQEIRKIYLMRGKNF